MLFQKQPTTAPTLNRSEDSSTLPVKKLSWMINNPPSSPIRSVITPELAEAMLQYNTANRPVSFGTVKHYAAQMEAGQWRETFTPIQFSGTRLIDGQHRLSAVVESGAAISAWVAFGADDEVFAFIDIGKKRTASDIFSINGVKNPNVVAAAVRWVYAYENDRSIHASTGPKANALRDPAPMYDYYQTLDTDRLHRSARASTWFAHHKMPNPSIACAAHYLCSTKSQRLADEFFEKVATGVGFLSKSEPEYKLRDRLTSTLHPVSRVQEMAFIIDAWNARRRNRRVGAFKFEGGRLPRVV